jgi:hypothetical protein
MRNLNQDSRSPGRNLNLEPLEYEAGVLTIWPLCLVVAVLRDIRLHVDTHT